MPNWITIKAVEGSRPRISIRGYIGGYAASDDFIAQQLAMAGDVDEMEVSINSRGGDAATALAIFNQLRNHPARVIVRIDGVAASAASIIAMAGDEIVMPANTLMLVHRPLIDGWVTAGEDDLRALADDLAVFETALVETYKARTGMGDEDLKALLKEDRWMTAAEAEKLGFADRVEPLARPSEDAIAEAASIPVAIVARVREVEAQAAEQAPAPAADAPAVPAPAAAPEKTGLDAEAVASLVEMCSRHQVSHLAAAFIREGLTTDQAAKRILDAKADQDERRQVDHQQPLPIDPVNGAGTGWDQAFSNVTRN